MVAMARDPRVLVGTRRPSGSSRGGGQQQDGIKEGHLECPRVRWAIKLSKTNSSSCRGQSFGTMP